MFHNSSGGSDQENTEIPSELYLPVNFKLEFKDDISNHYLAIYVKSHKKLLYD